MPNGALAANPIGATSETGDECRPATQRGHGLAPGLVRRAVDHEHAVQMVELVLGRSGGEALELERDGLASCVLRRHRHRGRPLDRHQKALEGETALLVRLQLVAVRGDLRIDERQRLAVLTRAYDEDAAEHADLRRREARPVGALHDRLQTLNELVELVVERLDLPRPHAQHRVRVLANLCERDQLPSLSLGIQPFFLCLAVLPVVIYVAWLTGTVDSKLAYLLLVNVILIVVGCFMEAIAAMLILIPILVPVAVQLGIDPLHFGLVFVLNLMIGTITPPVGIVLFVTAKVANIPFDAMARAIVPWILPLLAVLVAITLWPPLTTWLPGVVMGK